MTRKLALITGASGGIGLEIARLFARDGYDLALVARSADKLEAVAAELRANPNIVVTVFAQDLSVAGAARAVFGRIPACDVLVNNAGFASNGAFAAIDEARMLDEIALDVTALTQLTRLYLPGMIERKYGRILNVASTAAFLPGPNMAVYYASKAYVLSFSEALAEETRGTGVTVTCLCPGATATGFAGRAGMQGTPLMRGPKADAVDVARAGYNGMLAGKPVVVPGITNKLVGWTAHLTPRRLLLWVSRKTIEKGNE
ncbi:MAG TPA: SDR family oxidoreductase [Candidatus Baltobacteraceae bacterium]